MNLLEIYRATGDDGETGALARQLLAQQHWYSSLAEFDPRTGEALALGLGVVLRRLTAGTDTSVTRDRLWRILSHCRASVTRILGSLSESPRREQAFMPIRDVKEVNAVSLIALSRRPGRNVREKLAGKPYMHAVRRYQSVDLPENRLVKEFLRQLAELLELRREYLGQDDELLGSIRRWLRSEAAVAISPWDNLPPNNTLLAHRDYRRVWDAWRWLQVLDESVDSDFRQLDARAATVEWWKVLATAHADGEVFGDVPVLFDYECFTIEPWRGLLSRTTSRPRPAPNVAPAADSPACVDLTYLRPRYALAGSETSHILSEAFLWQRWARDHVSADLELFDADAAVLEPDVTSVSCADLFSPGYIDGSLVDPAAHSFTRKLHKQFQSPALIWLFPDVINDFELQVARRSLNARFAEAEPLPRSVAAVFEQIDHSALESAGFEVVVVDAMDDITYATKLVARHDAELQERVHATRGFYWERLPPVPISQGAPSLVPLTEIAYFDREDQWNDAAPARAPKPVSNTVLRQHTDVGEFDLCITLSESPVAGGIRLHELQMLAGDIPLWRDHIPELSIKVIKDGYYRPFILVDRNTTIRPIRGLPVSIPVNDHFVLPAGRRFYEFPLFQGRDPDDLGYVARLESPSFPLPTDARCRLSMTYTYGADDPYRLQFEPLDGSFKPVQAKWQAKTELVVTDAPAPEYPVPMTWSDLQDWKDQQGNEVDLLTWLDDSLTGLEKRVPLQSRITLDSHWREKTDPNGQVLYWYAFARADDGRNCYLNTNGLAVPIDGDPSSRLPPGSVLFARVRNQGGRFVASDVSEKAGGMSQSSRQMIQGFRERSLQNRMSTIWSDSRSLSDADCPEAFRARILFHVDEVQRLLPEDLLNEKMMTLFSFMHKDAPKSCLKWVADQAESGRVTDARAVGSSLGNLEMDWQRRVFAALLRNSTDSSTAALSYAIWRDQHLVSHMTLHDLRSILARVRAILGKVQPMPRTQQNAYDRRSWARAAAEPAELLLGLLRTRESSDPQIRMLLQPHQELTRRLAEDVDQVVEVVAASMTTLHSRVQLSGLPAKPDGDRTPDLLYALRLFLTGDVGANAIRVTGVVDGEDD
jgi:hypothetical protein